jgi:hypothetical protein
MNQFSIVVLLTCFSGRVQRAAQTNRLGKDTFLQY